MILSKTISNRELCAHYQDNPLQVLDMMENFELNAIPVVHQQIYQGLLTKESILNALDEVETIEEVPSLLPVFLLDSTHILDAPLFFNLHKVNIIPIINSHHQYLGFVDPISLLNELDNLLGSNQPGIILLLEMSIRDHSMARVAHLLESNQVKIHTLYLRELPESETVELTVKIAKEQASVAINTLQRHDYFIKSIFNFQELDNRDDLMARYENLMKYIDI